MVKFTDLYCQVEVWVVLVVVVVVLLYSVGCVLALSTYFLNCLLDN